MPKSNEKGSLFISNINHINFISCKIIRGMMKYLLIPLFTLVSVVGASSGIYASPGLASYQLTNASSEEGTFTATLRGGIEGTTNGKAMFNILAIESNKVFKLICYRYQDDGNYEAINLLVMDGGVPQAGTYTVSDEGPFLGAYIKILDGEMTVGGGDSGEVVITYSDEQRVSGTFRFSGELMKPGGRADVKAYSIEGTFDAPRGDEAQLPTAFKQ